MMSPSSLKTFRAVLEPSGNELRWVIARVPFDVAKAWPERNGRRVRGEINGFPFRTSLFPNARDGGHVLLVNKTMQAGAHARAGDTAQFRLEPDMEERKAIVPAELARALRGERGLRRWFDALNPSRRRDVGRWVSEPKTAETRERRAEQMAERLLLAMEGEEEPPPILRTAFLGHPQARAGWDAMTPIRRRNHLLAIFYYQTSEGRARRAGEAIEDALRVAKRLDRAN
jgi:uncharacterized protein YdeI (YjbR/CyaY-like superfamily)